MANKIFKVRYLISSKKTLRSIVKSCNYEKLVIWSCNSFGQLADVGCMTFISITFMKSEENL